MLPSHSSNSCDCWAPRPSKSSCFPATTPLDGTTRPHGTTRTLWQWSRTTTLKLPTRLKKLDLPLQRTPARYILNSRLQRVNSIILGQELRWPGRGRLQHQRCWYSSDCRFQDQRRKRWCKFNLTFFFQKIFKKFTLFSEIRLQYQRHLLLWLNAMDWQRLWVRFSL